MFIKLTSAGGETVWVNSRSIIKIHVIEYRRSPVSRLMLGRTVAIVREQPEEIRKMISEGEATP